MFKSLRKAQSSHTLNYQPPLAYAVADAPAVPLNAAAAPIASPKVAVKAQATVQPEATAPAQTNPQAKLHDDISIPPFVHYYLKYHSFGIIFIIILKTNRRKTPINPIIRYIKS